MKIKINSDGTASGTRVVDSISGELLENVSAVFWSVAAGSDGLAEAGLTIQCVPVTLVGEAEIKKFTPLEATCQE